MIWSNYSEKGAQLNSVVENLDNPIPGACFTQQQQQYWSPEAMSKNPMCQPGQLCNRKYSVGFWSKDDIPSVEKNTQMQLGVTQLHTSYPVDQAGSYSQETVGGCCPTNCCDRPTSTPFWEISQDKEMLDQYSRNDIVKCMGLADGDHDKFIACLRQ